MWLDQSMFNDVNYNLPLTLLVIVCLGIYTAIQFYNVSRIAVIFGESGVCIVNEAKHMQIKWEWSDIVQHKMFSDTFGREYIVLSIDTEKLPDDNFLMRKCSKVLLSDTVAAFIVTSKEDKEEIIGFIDKYLIV